MTIAAVPVALGPAPLSLDWRRVLKFGLILALVEVFVALAGFPVGLKPRVMIKDVLDLGYLSLCWLPVLVGYGVGKETELEGMATREKGPIDVVAGAAVGAIGGAGLSLLILLINTFDIRDPLVNWSPQLLERLAFENSIAFGLIIWPVIGAALGAVGALFHVLPGGLRRVLTMIVVTLLSFAVFETIISDLLRGFEIDSLGDFLYAKQGGLTVKSTATIAAITAVLAIGAKGRTKAIKANYEALEGTVRSRTNVALIILAGITLIVLPRFLGKITNELLANVGIFLLLALGLNIVVGIAGILDLGYVAFFAVGGYTTAVLTSPNSPGFSPELPWLVALIFVVLMAGVVGLLIGAPVIRMRGDYLAIVTLGFGEIIRLLFLSDWLSGWFGGAQGITNIPGAGIFGLASVKGTDPRAVFYLVLFFSAIAIYVSWRLEKSRLGRAWMAIREDESVAEAMGINTVNVKLMAFVVGAILASFSGAIFAAKVGSIFPTSFLILVSVIILVVVIVGGMGNIPGVIVGSLVLIGVLGGPKQPGLLAEFSQYKLLIYGALLIWMMLKRPEGLVPSKRRTRELHQEEFLQDAWLKGEVDTGDDPGGTGPETEVAPA